MELYKVDNYAIKQLDIEKVRRISEYSSPYLPIGFKCNKNVPYRVVKKNSGGEELFFSEMSFSDVDENICYMFYKSTHMKKNMIANLIHMFEKKVLYIQIYTPIGKENSLIGIKFEPIFAIYQNVKVDVKGKRTGFFSKRNRFCFKNFVDINDVNDVNDVDNIVKVDEIDEVINTTKGVEMEITKEQHKSKLLRQKLFDNYQYINV